VKGETGCGVTVFGFVGFKILDHQFWKNDARGKSFKLVCIGAGSGKMTEAVHKDYQPVPE